MVVVTHITEAEVEITKATEVATKEEEVGTVKTTHINQESIMESWIRTLMSS